MSRHLLLLSSAARVVMGQDTGGPYTGTVSVNSDTSGSCIDNRGQMIQEGRLFEPGPDECQVGVQKEKAFQRPPSSFNLYLSYTFVRSRL